MENNSIKTSYQVIKVNELRLGTYQRNINMKKIKTMAKEFDEKLLGTITVSKRTIKVNGKGIVQYFIVDGQHRVVLAKTVGIKELMALVYEGLTFEEEAKLFVEINRSPIKPTQIDIFNAMVEAKDPKALDIKFIVEKLGFRIFSTSGTNCLAAINAIEKIYNKYGNIHLYNTLKLIKDTWYGESNSLSSLMLTGVSEFIKIYSGQNNFNESTFINQLSKVTAKKVIADSKDDKTTNKVAVRTMNTLFMHYNKSLRTKKLENKHFIM